MPELKCIYCLKDVLVGGFNSEHVISQAFGRFERNLTLTNMVCRICNQFFGDKLELVFARDSFEAYDRIKTRLKPAENIPEMPQRRLTFTAALGGQWQGLRLSLTGLDGSEAVTLEAQVGLPKRGCTDWVYLTEADLADRGKALPADFDPHGHIRVIGPTYEVRQRLIATLADRGIPFRQMGNFPLPQPDAGEIVMYVNMQIDPVVKRCVAKYAFNYMAHVEGRDFALLPAFDATRAYIRQGSSPGYQIVAADNTPILATDTRTARQTVGHLVTLNWTADKRHIVAQVSLFNRVTYRVSLARDFSGLWRPIRSGHHFDIASGRISPLAATSLIVPGRRAG